MTVGSRYVLGIAVLGAMLFGHGNAQAHFVLTSPPAAYDQNALGDPQKAPPCGDDGTATPTGIVTAYQAGETITISIDETIYHPGHYRVALAVNDPSELPEPPPVTAGDTDCGSTTIMSPPVYPVLADGELVHDAPFGKPQSIQVTLPDDVNCTNCTLQIIQFMSEHGLNVPGGCFYSHCATISIEGGAADASTTMPGEDSATSDGGDDSTTAATNVTTADDGTDSSGGADASATNASATNATGMTTTNVPDTDTDSAGMTDDEDGGCSCSSSNERSALALLLPLLGLLGLRRRR